MSTKIKKEVKKPKKSPSKAFATPSKRKQVLKKTLGTLGVLGALGVSALLLSKMRKEKYPKEEQVEDLRKAKEEQDRAVQNLSRELNKIKGLMIFDSDVCKSYKNLVSFLEKTCKYSPDTKKCVSKRISEYRLNTTDINEAVKILKCI